MTRVVVQRAASSRLDEIYRYTLENWGRAQADHYIEALFESFDDIATRQTAFRPIPAEYGVEGYFYRFRRHVVYWKPLADGSIGIVTILHERMHPARHLRQDLPP